MPKLPGTVTVRVRTAGADPIDHEVEVPAGGQTIAEVLAKAGISAENKNISRDVRPGDQASAGDILILTDKVKPGSAVRVAERPQGS